MNNKLVYTPGPTEVRENVRLARVVAIWNFANFIKILVKK